MQTQPQIQTASGLLGDQRKSHLSLQASLNLAKFMVLSSFSLYEASSFDIRNLPAQDEPSTNRPIPLPSLVFLREVFQRCTSPGTSVKTISWLYLYICGHTTGEAYTPYAYANCGALVPLAVTPIGIEKSVGRTCR
jgi:hypothetical protein